MRAVLRGGVVDLLARLLAAVRSLARLLAVVRSLARLLAVVRSLARLLAVVRSGAMWSILLRVVAASLSCAWRAFM